MSQKETLPVRKSESILDQLLDAENRIRERAFDIFSCNAEEARARKISVQAAGR